jgi:sugar lactone lactonase YvrE
LRESGPPVLAVRDGYANLDPSSGRLELIAPIAPDDQGIRMNDGKVGPDGGFWAGSMAGDESQGRGSLHRLDPDGTVTEVLTDLTIPNGLDWTADGRELLFIDTPRDELIASTSAQTVEPSRVGVPSWRSPTGRAGPTG